MKKGCSNKGKEEIRRPSLPDSLSSLSSTGLEKKGIISLSFRDLIYFILLSHLYSPGGPFPPDPADTYLHRRAGPRDLPHIPALLDP